MFDLNGEDFQEREVKAIFNNAKAGKVDGVTIKGVDKKPMDGAPGAPDYNVVIADGISEIRVGFWKEPKNAKVELGRALSIARALVGKDFVFPKATDETAAAALDVIMKVIRDNISAKLFNVFVNYGTAGYPKQYLTIRYFDFIEPADIPEANTRLRVKPDDLLEKVSADAPAQASTPSSSTALTDATANNDWV